MSIEVTCVQCGSSHLVNDALAGRRVRCPSCDTAVHVPEIDMNAPESTAQEPAAEPVVAEPVVAEPIDTERVTLGAPAEPIAQPSIQTAPVRAETAADDDDDDRVLPRSNRPEQEMDMTPMVDVTFLLLIFFMVTAAFSLQKSIEMPRQQTDLPSTSVVEEETEDLDMVEVEIDESGTFLVMAPDWELETPGKQNLLTALKEAISGNTAGMRLSIKVHEMAKLNALVDAMDAGTIAGYAELEVTQVEDFD